MKNSLNVLLISVRADFGGGPKHVDLLIQGLRNISHLYVACPDDVPYYLRWKEADNVKEVIQIPHRKFSIKSLWNIRSFCIRHNIHIVHSHGKGAGIYSRMLKLILPSVKIVHTYHGLHIHEYSPSMLQAYLFLEKAFYLLTHKYINVSYGEQQKCVERGILGLEKSVVIFNGIIGLEKTTNQKRLFNLENKFVIATISRFDDSKYMDLAFRIARSLKNVPDIAFLWIGDGPDRAEIERKAKEEDLRNIIFSGFQQDVARFLNASDIYLSTSRWEGLPFALIEALSLGIPLVATDVVGNNEVVRNKVNGFLYELNNVEAAKGHILKLYKEPALLNIMSEAAMKDFEERFLKEKMISQLEVVYNEAI